LRTALTVTGLQTYGYHGLFDEERQLGQKFLFDVRAELASTQTHLHDSLEASVRYDALLEEIIRISDSKKFRTLEALGEAIARRLLERFEKILNVTVVVSKMSPPIPHSIDKVSVEIHVDRK
jgi:7,8-dihydroneopterin aldolase/epimerase/oxygenase